MGVTSIGRRRQMPAVENIFRLAALTIKGIKGRIGSLLPLKFKSGYT